MGFRLVQKSVTLNDLERSNGRYFELFQRIRVASGAQSHLLVGCCLPLESIQRHYLACTLRARNLPKFSVMTAPHGT